MSRRDSIPVRVNLELVVCKKDEMELRRRGSSPGGLKGTESRSLNLLDTQSIVVQGCIREERRV